MLSEWLRATGVLLEQSQTLKAWGHSSRPLRLIWTNAERFLCRDLKTDVREGNAGHLTVIIEFASLAAAKAAYEAPEYQAMLKLRQPHSDVSLSILEEGDHAGH